MTKQRTAPYIIESVLAELQRTKAPKPSLRVVFFQRISVKALELEGVHTAFMVKLASGYRFHLAMISSEGEREKLLRECKARRKFIPLIVESGKEKFEALLERIQFLFFNGIRYVKRMTQRRNRFQPRLSPGACGI